MANDNATCDEPTNEVPSLSRDRACDIPGKTSSIPSGIQNNITINAHNGEIKGNDIIGRDKIGNQYIYNGNSPLPVAEFLPSKPRRLWSSLKLYKNVGTGFNLVGGIGIILGGIGFISNFFTIFGTNIFELYYLSPKIIGSSSFIFGIDGIVFILGCMLRQPYISIQHSGYYEKFGKHIEEGDDGYLYITKW